MKKDYYELYNEIIDQIDHDVKYGWTICRKERDDLIAESNFLFDVLGIKAAYNFLVTGYKCLKNDRVDLYLKLLVEFHTRAAFETTLKE